MERCNVGKRNWAADLNHSIAHIRLRFRLHIDGNDYSAVRELLFCSIEQTERRTRSLIKGHICQFLIIALSKEIAQRLSDSKAPTTAGVEELILLQRLKHGESRWDIDTH